MANDAAVKAGVTVTVSTGDAGVTNTIGSPATDPNVISAGASTTYRAYAQTGVGDITAPGVKGWLDNNISGLSSGGFAQNGSTVDVVAPGDLNWALCTAEPGDVRRLHQLRRQAAPRSSCTGGTSEAAPLTAGVAALVIQAYREAHNGATPSPAVVKQIIVSTAREHQRPGRPAGGRPDRRLPGGARRRRPTTSTSRAGTPSWPAQPSSTPSASPAPPSTSPRR